MEKPAYAQLTFTKTLLMGILNVTPDSFSDGGRYLSVHAAVNHAKRMISQGAQVIDVGGESTRPEADPVDPEEEQGRILPVLSKIKPYAADRGVLISIDTVHAGTAAAALESGADIINDVSGFNVEPAMIELMSQNASPYVITHNRGTPHTMDSLTDYGNRTITAAVIAQLHDLIEKFLAAGVPQKNIIVDPGFGFSKTMEQNWELIKNLGSFIRHFKSSGYPVLIGTSRKRFLGAINSSSGRRDAPTAFTTLKAAEGGAWAVRVHNVPMNRMAIEFCSTCREN